MGRAGTSPSEMPSAILFQRSLKSERVNTTAPASIKMVSDFLGTLDLLLLWGEGVRAAHQHHEIVHLMGICCQHMHLVAVI